MKNIIQIVLLSILFFGCKKVERDPNDYYPKVKITAAKLLPDGTVEVTGEVLEHGTKDVTFAGFCMDTIPNFSMMSNQQKVESLDGNKFSYIYTGLNKSHKYFFRAWATNPYGYHVSEEVLPMENVTIGADFVPCTLPLDTMVMTKNQTEKKYSLNMNGDIDYTWQVNLYDYYSTTQVSIQFSKKPVSGIYKTSESNTVGDATVNMLVNRTRVKNGANVYVREISTEEIEVSICEAVMSDNTKVALKFRAKFE